MPRRQGTKPEQGGKEEREGGGRKENKRERKY